MSLNDLRLPDLLISDLYKNVIVQSIEEQKVRDSTIDKSPTGKRGGLTFLGENRSQIAILVDYASEVYLPEGELQFLANILNACKLNLADIAIVNTSKQVLNITLLSNALHSKKIVCFGEATGKIPGDEIPYFEIGRLEGMDVLKAPSLEELNQQNDKGKLLKSRLWLCLRELFAVV
jgi:hypothetical protein